MLHLFGPLLHFGPPPPLPGRGEGGGWPGGKGGARGEGTVPPPRSYHRRWVGYLVNPIGNVFFTEIPTTRTNLHDANIVSIPARFISEETALKIVETFFSTEFEGGRHQTRVDKIACR